MHEALVAQPAHRPGLVSSHLPCPPELPSGRLEITPSSTLGMIFEQTPAEVVAEEQPWSAPGAAPTTPTLAEKPDRAGHRLQPDSRFAVWRNPAASAMLGPKEILR